MFSDYFVQLKTIQYGIQFTNKHKIGLQPTKEPKKCLFCDNWHGFTFRDIKC